MKILILALSFLAVITVLALIIVKLFDKFSRVEVRFNKKPAVANDRLGASIKTIEVDLGLKVKKLETILNERLSHGKLDFPQPNQDLRLRSPVAPSDDTLTRLGWVDHRYLPVAEINDGDLLLVDTQQDQYPIYSYFHDGGEFDLIYPSIEDALNQLR